MKSLDPNFSRTVHVPFNPTLLSQTPFPCHCLHTFSIQKPELSRWRILVLTYTGLGGLDFLAFTLLVLPQNKNFLLASSGASLSLPQDVIANLNPSVTSLWNFPCFCIYLLQEKSLLPGNSQGLPVLGPFSPSKKKTGRIPCTRASGSLPHTPWAGEGHLPC